MSVPTGEPRPMPAFRIPGPRCLPRALPLLLAGAFAATPAPTAAAVDWMRIGGDDESAIYLDVANVREAPDGRRAWVLYELATPMPDGARSVRSLTEIDCAGGRSRYLQGEFFLQPKAGGGLVRSFHTATEWCHAAPGTIGMLVLQAVCSLPSPPPPRRISGLRAPSPGAC